MSLLLTRQQELMERIPLLLAFATKQGHKVTGGDLYRDKRCPYGSKSSRHKSRLAIDLNLFGMDRGGKHTIYLTRTTDHLELGEYWESLGGVWGGRFNDGNHYEAPYPGDWVPHINGEPL